MCLYKKFYEAKRLNFLEILIANIWKLRSFLSLLLTIGVFFALIKFIGSHNLITTFKAIKLKYALMALFLSLIFPFLGALRWHWVLKATGQTISILNCLILTMGAWPINAFLPSRTGDFIRVAFLGKDTSKTKAFGSIIAEKILDVACLALIGLLGAIGIKDKKFAMIFLVILMILIIISSQGLSFSERWLKNKKSKILKNVNLTMQGMNILSSCPKSCAIATIWAFINWSLSVVQVLLFFKAFGTYVHPLEISARLPLSIFIGILPITLAGMGTRDAAMLYFFKEFAPASTIFGVAIFYTLYSYFLYALLGLPFFIYLTNRNELSLKKDYNNYFINTFPK